MSSAVNLLPVGTAVRVVGIKEVGEVVGYEGLYKYIILWRDFPTDLGYCMDIKLDVKALVTDRSNVTPYRRSKGERR